MFSEIGGGRVEVEVARGEWRRLKQADTTPGTYIIICTDKLGRYLYN